MGLEKYMDIIGHVHHEPVRHPRMSAMDRAAQFAPFAALTGYESVIAETGRATQDRMELDEMQVLHLNETMAFIQENLASRPRVRLTHFIPDAHKEGGCYATIEANVRNIDHSAAILVLSDDRMVKLSDIYDMEVINTIIPDTDQK